MFFNTLNRVSGAGNQYCVCEKRGICNARINTTQEGIVIKPTGFSEIVSSHSYGLDPGRSQMLKAYQSMKECAPNSGEKLLLILSKGISKLDETTIITLPRLDSIKRTIRRHKCLDEDSSINQASAAELIIPDIYRITLKGELLLIYDSGIGDSNRMLIFSAPKMLSLLQGSQSWYADGTFKVVLTNKVIQSFTALMVEFPTTAIEITVYFKETYWKNIAKQYQKNFTISNKNMEPIY